MSYLYQILNAPTVFDQRDRYEALKRMFDVCVSSVALLLLSPVFFVISLIIKRDGGPAFYSQVRIGKRGRPFKFYKFRSMVPNADKLRKDLEASNEMAQGVTFKMKSDPRITPVGRFIRRFSLDELPQLWNVFIGDLSLVGPRPALPDEVSKYSHHQRQRLSVQQGLTCFWQVSGRNLLDFEQQVELDLKYASKASFLTDLSILLKTVPAVISGKGAY